MNRIAIFSGWHFMRWLRLLVGAYALWQSIEMSDWMLAVAGVFLLVMPDLHRVSSLCNRNQ